MGWLSIVRRGRVFCVVQCDFRSARFRWRMKNPVHLPQGNSARLRHTCVRHCERARYAVKRKRSGSRTELGIVQLHPPSADVDAPAVIVGHSQRGFPIPPPERVPVRLVRNRRCRVRFDLHRCNGTVKHVSSAVRYQDAREEIDGSRGHPQCSTPRMWSRSIPPRLIYCQGQRGHRPHSRH